MSVKSALHRIADLMNHQDLHDEIEKEDAPETEDTEDAKES